MEKRLFLFSGLVIILTLLAACEPNTNTLPHSEMATRTASIETILTPTETTIPTATPTDGPADGVELILTGRYCPQEWIDKADLVTEMIEVKHYYTRGVTARRGFES